VVFKKMREWGVVEKVNILYHRGRDVDWV